MAAGWPRVKKASRKKRIVLKVDLTNLTPEQRACLDAAAARAGLGVSSWLPWSAAEARAQSACDLPSQTSTTAGRDWAR